MAVVGKEMGCVADQREFSVCHNLTIPTEGNTDCLSSWAFRRETNFPFVPEHGS